MIIAKELMYHRELYLLYIGNIDKICGLSIC